MVRAQELSFSEDGVAGIVKDVLLKWYNTMQFFNQSKHRLELTTGTAFKPSAEVAASSTNVMDKWIMSTIQTLNRNVKREMEAYFLYKVVPNLLNFIEQITNWYACSACSPVVQAYYELLSRSFTQLVRDCREGT